MDLISMAFSLAQFAPSILKWITGSDKAADAAGKVVDIAETITGRKGPEAVQALQADPSLVLQFRAAVLASEADLDKAYLADVQDARSRDVQIRQVAGGKNPRADIMLALTYLGIVGLVCLMVFKEIDANSALGGIVILLVGKLIGQWETGFQFEFGSTRSNKSMVNTIENLSGHK
jgi:hypothetical protein